MKTPPKGFVDWCHSIPDRPVAQYVLSNYVKKDTVNSVKTFVDDVHESLKRHPTTGIDFNSNLPPTQVIHLRQEHLSYDHELTFLNIRSSGFDLTLERLPIGSAIISVGDAPTTIIIRDCAIRRLEVHGCKSIELVNSQVGTLGLTNALIRNFDMRGGCILDIECPPPWEKSPFTGAVSLVDVFLPRDPEKYLIKTPQPYRNLRAHLRRLENSQSANLIHSTELAMERKFDNRTNKLLSHLYELLSDFGSSALRPLVWLSLLWLVSFIAIFLTNGAALAFAQADYTGWRSVLTHADTAGQVSRAAVLALQQLASPLTILGAKPLLVPEYLWLAVWSVIQSLLSVVLIALFILAVRRRFKMQ